MGRLTVSARRQFNCTRGVTLSLGPVLLAPRMHQSTNRRGVREPQVWFRIVHTSEDGHHSTPGGVTRQQPVEIALGPKGAFENGSACTLMRHVRLDRVVSALPQRRCRPRHSREPVIPRIVELLQKAVEWQVLINSGEARNRAEIARREGITRARVTQVMALLRLAPEIQEHIRAMPEMVGRPGISERALRPVVQMEDPTDQTARFQELTQHTE